MRVVVVVACAACSSAHRSPATAVAVSQAPPSVREVHDVPANLPVVTKMPGGVRMGNLRDARLVDGTSELCATDHRPVARTSTCNGRLFGDAVRDYGPGFRAGFVLQRPVVHVHDPVIATFVIENPTSVDLTLQPGGYATYGTHRPARFAVSAVTAAHAPVADPDNTMEVDGIGMASTYIPAGSTYAGELDLADYLALDAPGRYTITATRRIMGWDATATNLEITSTLVLDVVK